LRIVNDSSDGSKNRGQRISTQKQQNSQQRYDASHEILFSSK
jgi:hypothetical protein